MNPRFSPLLKTSDDKGGQKQSFKLKVLSSEDVKTPFQTLSSAITASNAGKGRNAREASDDHEHEPKIDLKRDGEKITRITVTCGCGTVMEIDCDYAV
jgi:hypothetical protein